jgi:hypothetical protein
LKIISTQGHACSPKTASPIHAPRLKSVEEAQRSRVKEAGDRTPGEREHHAEDARASTLKKAKTEMNSDGSGIDSDRM